LIATIAVFAAFSVVFLARPRGGILFGHFGDRVGRKSILMITLLLMGVGTAAIGLLPTYDRIGIWAPIALVTLRFLQGFALGGKSVGALLLTVEGSPSGRRGLFGGVIQAAGPVRVILASMAVTIVPTGPWMGRPAKKIGVLDRKIAEFGAVNLEGEIEPCNLEAFTQRKSSDLAVRHLCAELNATETLFPGTELRLIYELVASQNL